MWKSFIKSSFRVLVRHRSFSIVNTLGFAIGISVFIALSLYIQFELSFDTFHENADRIYRIEQIMNEGGRIERLSGTPEPLWKVFEEEFPEVEASIRLVDQEAELTPEEGEPFVTKLFFVEHNFLTSFTFKMVQGDPQTALNEPFQMVITRSVAIKLFGTEDVLGRSYEMYDNMMTISGVIEDVPANSHMDFDVLVSVETANQIFGNGQNIFTSWANNWVHLYVMLNEDNDIDAFNQKINDILKTHYNEETLNELRTIPLLNIHLHDESTSDYAVRGSMRNIYILITMAVFVLIMAGINFTNLSIAYTTVRASEVCLRKLNGASRKVLLIQYLSESLVMTFVAIIIGLVIFESFLPFFNRLVNRSLDFKYLGNWSLLLFIIGMGLITGLLSGAYPAILISRSDPGDFVRSQMSKGNRNPVLRKILISTQFFISTALIIGMFGVYRQARFMMKKDLGFNPAGIIRFEFTDSTMVRIERLQQILAENPAIKGSTIHDYPVCESDNWTRVTWEGAQEDEFIRMNVNYTDQHYLDVYQIRLSEGSGFLAKQQGIDPEGNLVILNQAAVRRIQMQDPIGKKILYGGDYRGVLNGYQATIVGVVDDYHFLSVHHEITPLMLRLYNELQTGYSISVRFDSEDIPGVLAFIKKEFDDTFPGQAFDYEFVDEYHNSMYEEETKMSGIILYIAILANLIAALGLYGLIAYSTSLRTREVGLRKVLGANFITISRLFSKEFIVLVLLSNLAAWPAAYYAIHKWLQAFPYRVSFSVLPYLIALLVTVFIAYCSMLYHTYRSSLINPAESLRYE